MCNIQMGIGIQPHYDIKCGQLSEENPFKPFHLSESVSVADEQKKIRITFQT